MPFPEIIWKFLEKDDQEFISGIASPDFSTIAREVEPASEWGKLLDLVLALQWVKELV